MDKCSQFKDKLSAYIDRELSQAELKEVGEHINSCELCQNEIQMLKTAKDGLRTMLPKAATDDVKNRILGKVFEQGGEKGRGVIWNIKAFSRRHSLPYKGLALAASLLLIILINISDTTSSTLKTYIIEHQNCMNEGHRDYLCKTEHELSRKIEKSMGVKAFLPSYFPEGFTFVKGDVCKVKGVTFAHMVMGDGKRMLSYFQSKEEITKKKMMQFGKLNNHNFAYWKKNGVYCMVVGDISDSEMIKIASSQPPHHPSLSAEGREEK